MPKSLMYILDSESYMEDLAGILTEEAGKRSVIYVTTNKPYTHMANLLEDKGVDTGKVFFIDCISNHVGEAPEEEPDNCLLLEGPGSLTDISIAINKSVEAVEGDKVLILDSLSVLLIYNDASTVGKFSNFLVNQMRSTGADSIILALESDMDKDIIKRVETFVDEVRKEDD